MYERSCIDTCGTIVYETLQVIFLASVVPNYDYMGRAARQQIETPVPYKTITA